MKILTSAVIITRDRHSLLEQALVSVAAQTLPPDEVVVVDDSSATPVPEALPARILEQGGVSWRLVRIHAGSPGAARNAGAHSASGTYLAFLDDDDLWQPEYLQLALPTLVQGAHDCLITWFDDFDSQGQKPGKRFPPSPTLDELFVDNLGSIGSNLLLKRDSLLNVGGFDPELMVSEDKDLLIRLAESDASVAVLQQPLVLHRTDSAGGQISDEKVVYRTQGRKIFYEKHQHRVSPAARRKLRAKMDAMTLLWNPRMGTRLLALARLLLTPRLLAGTLRRLTRRRKN